jgi:hypothetical protein
VLILTIVNNASNSLPDLHELIWGDTEVQLCEVALEDPQFWRGDKFGIDPMFGARHVLVFDYISTGAIECIYGGNFGKSE